MVNNRSFSKKIVAIIIGFFVAYFFLLPITLNASFNDTSIPLNTEYVPNHVIVKFKQNKIPTDLKVQINQQQSSIVGSSDSLSQDTASNVSNDQIPQQPNQAINVLNAQNGVSAISSIQTFNQETYLFITDGKKLVNEIITQYQALPEVEYAQPDYIYHPLAIPNDTHYGKMWSLTKIRAPAAWDISTGSKNILVADIDTGVDSAHTDLAPNIVEYKSLVGCTTDYIGHGTHTAGTIGAVGNNNKGVVGFSWNVGLLIIKADSCSNPGSFNTSILTTAINYAVQKGARAINISLGGPGGPTSDPVMANAIAQAVQRNTLVVAAAGNDGRENANYNYPASDPNVICVSATGPNDELAVYSSYGSTVDITAPGGNAPGGSRNCTTPLCPLSTSPGNQYVAMEGTSMSAPHVTGLIGLMFSVNPNLTSTQVKQILYSTAVDLGTPGKDNKFGAGRIDAKAALDAVLALNGPLSPTPYPTTVSTITPTRIPTTIVSSCADFNGNGTVDLYDFEAWRLAYRNGKSTLKCFNIWRKAYFGTFGN